MNKIQLFFLILFWAALTLGVVNAQNNNGGSIKTDPKFLEDFMSKRFGMFIHWEPVSLRGTEIGWSRGHQVPTEEYDNLYDNTILFFYSDHGDGLPYVKREIHHRGLRVPLIIKAPFLKGGTIDDQLISFIDLAPSLLSLAGVPIPKSIQGQAFLGSQKVYCIEIA